MQIIRQNVSFMSMRQMEERKKKSLTTGKKPKLPRPEKSPDGLYIEKFKAKRRSLAKLLPNSFDESRSNRSHTNRRQYASSIPPNQSLRLP